MHARGAHPGGGEGEQARAGADVDKVQARELVTAEHRPQRGLGLGDARLSDHTQEARPVLPELEALAGGNLRREVRRRHQLATNSAYRSP
jgi:hypothetical protein